MCARNFCAREFCALQIFARSAAPPPPHHRLTTLPLLPQVMTQVVAGVNYFVKVKVGEGDEYAFLRIYDRFGDVQLTSFQLGKTASDPIAYFE
jgi:hypothetical protein